MNRNYLKNAGGAAVVSHAILCGAPNHGTIAMDSMLDGEFNGKGHFLRQLNDGSEVVEGVKFLTLRSDKLDKYAQPNVGYDSPALKGAENVVLPSLDHREVAFHPLAFAETYRFVSGQTPRTLTPVAQAAPVFSGLITGFAGIVPTNRPLAGVQLQVFALKPGAADRDGNAVLETTTGETGEWGPLSLRADRNYEFVLEKDGRKVSYFKSGLLRSTTLLNFRFWPEAAMQMLGGQALTGPRLLIHRPQGYLSRDRDPLLVDGVAVEALLPGVPTRDGVGVAIASDKRAGVRVELRGEVVHARPAEKPNELNIVELLWE